MLGGLCERALFGHRPVKAFIISAVYEREPVGPGIQKHVSGLPGRMTYQRLSSARWMKQ